MEGHLYSWVRRLLMRIFIESGWLQKASLRLHEAEIQITEKRKERTF